MNYWTKKFNKLNKKYWDGDLSKIKVTITNLLETEGAEGLYVYPEYEEDKDGNVFVSTPAKIYLDRSLSHYKKINVLLHEMCHHAVEEYYEDRPYHDHGKWWKQEMVRGGFKGKITSTRGHYKTRNL